MTDPARDGQWAIRPVPAASPLAAELIGRYVAEIAATLPGGFDPRASVSAEPSELAPPGGDFLVAFGPGDEAVGCGAIKSLGVGSVELKRMWVAPEVRGRGLGRALLYALEQRARELGATVVRLDTASSLDAAVALYRRAGYRSCEPYNDNPYASMWFEKQL